MPRHFFADEIQQLFFAVVFFDNLIINIRTVEAGDKFGRIVQVQIMLDVGARGGIGGSGQGDARDVRIAFGKDAELLVFGAEIVPPLADTMRLVNGKQTDGLLVEKTQKAVGNQAFRCDIKQFQTALGKLVGNLARLICRCAAVDCRCFNPGHMQAGHLVVHQRNQRRYDNRHAFAHQRGNLVTQRLAPARRHQHHQTPAACQSIDDSLLPAAKFGITEYFVQNLFGGRSVHDGSVLGKGVGRSAAICRLKSGFRRVCPLPSQYRRHA